MVVKAARVLSAGLAVAALTAVIAVTGFTFATLAIVAVIFGTLREVSQVPLGALVKGQFFEGPSTRHASHLRQFISDVAVDSQVSADVPDLGIDTVGTTAGNVVKNQMVELMLENATHMLFGQAGKEVRIVNHLKLSSVGIYPNTRCGDGSAGTLLNLAAECSKERLIHEQSVSVQFKVKAHAVPLSNYIIAWIRFLSTFISYP